MSDSTSQPSSRIAKSGKFTSLSRAIKRSDIRLEVLSLQNRKSFEYFLCFHQTLSISPKDYANPRLRLGFALLSRILPTPLVFISGYANTEKVFYRLTLSLSSIDQFKIYIMKYIFQLSFMIFPWDIHLSAKLHKAQWVIQLLNHLLGVPNQASSRHFQERPSAVTFVLKFFPYRIVNLLNISSVFTEL